MYVCLCSAVTDGEIRDAVAQGARSLADLRTTLGVASCCGRCAEHAGNLVAESCRAAADRAGGND